MEVEFTAASVVVAEMIGIRKLLGVMVVYSVMTKSLKLDNQAALMQLDEESSSKAKHIRENKVCGLVRKTWDSQGRRL